MKLWFLFTFFVFNFWKANKTYAQHFSHQQENSCKSYLVWYNETKHVERHFLAVSARIKLILSMNVGYCNVKPWHVHGLTVWSQKICTFLASALWCMKELCLLVLLLRGVLRWRWVWSISGLTLTGETWSTWRKTWPSTALSTTKWTGPGSNLGVYGDRSATTWVTAQLWSQKFIYVFKNSVSTSQKTLSYNVQLVNAVWGNNSCLLWD
jgi:hypothetical protein